MTEKYLVSFVQQFPSFRLPELDALALLFDIQLSYDKEMIPIIESDDPDIESPFMYITVNSEEDIHKLSSRAILIRSIYKIFSEGDSYDQLLSNLNNSIQQDKLLATYLDGKTFRIDVEAYGKKYNQKEKITKMHLLKESSFWDHGDVSMKPKEGIEHCELSIIEDFGVERPDRDGARKLYFGRRLISGNRDAIFKFNLQDRRYLGTTSMDPELSLISANMGLVKSGHLVLDPFVGTGSFILVSAFCGAQVLGCDIDIKAMRKTEECNLETNFDDYGLKDNFLGILLSDNSIPAWRVAPIFDSIICDPPYGIRAGARKIGFKENRKWVNTPEGFSRDHIPQCIDYKVPEVMADLLELAAKTLVIGGRLVYWLPTTHEFKLTDLPKHPCLKLINANSFQALSKRWGRRLVTMEKSINFDPILHDKSKLTEDDLGQIEPQHSDLRSVVYWRKGEKEEPKHSHQKNKESSTTDSNNKNI
ncbi:hypothetical protein CYY_005289 [Polysphondylium violaceum]|uniref:tRNA (guanine(10)-N(2))-methyltransferase n=1 Tax=Polysphondylium violaceum TaxID=133409 RepID=A0A8J4UYQ7_9MYCE|nr:hypothetical protein CYY_005289 [Polysphondylium violaceum]